MLKWIFRGLAAVALILVVVIPVIIHKYPEYAFAKGVGWIELYRGQIGGTLKIVDSGFWLSLDRFVERRTLRITRDGINSLDLYALRFNPKKVDFRVIHIPAAEIDSRSMPAIAKASNALAMINANFFDASFKVLGLCVSQGAPVAPLASAKSYHGVFFATRSGVDLVGTKTYKRKNYRLKNQSLNAVQGGVWLVRDGKSRLRFKEKTRVERRSCIAMDKKGRVIMVATDTFFSGITLFDLARVLGTPEKNGGFGVVKAMNLDGGTSTQLLVRTQDENYMVRGFINVPSYIAVYRKGIL